MKKLRIILGSVYPVIIALLLINACNRRPKHDIVQNEPSQELITEEEAMKIGNRGDLKVTLLWDFQADIDLHVKQPNGREIYFEDKRDASTTGFLDKDDRDGEGRSAENIYWEHPPKGSYYVTCVYYASKGDAPADAGKCTVIVFQKGKPTKTYRFEMTKEGDVSKIPTIVVD